MDYSNNHIKLILIFTDQMSFQKKTSNLEIHALYNLLLLIH